MRVVVSITSFLLWNIKPEPQNLETICFLKLNNTLEPAQSSHIPFSVLKDFFDRVRFLVNYQSDFQPAII